jgi:hypothetical protein
VRTTPRLIAVLVASHTAVALARYHDPGSSRFLPETDVAEMCVDPASLHRYIYAKDNPLRYTDPDGHEVVPGTFATEWAPVEASETSKAAAARLKSMKGKVVLEDRTLPTGQFAETDTLHSTLTKEGGSLTVFIDRKKIEKAGELVRTVDDVISHEVVHADRERARTALYVTPEVRERVAAAKTDAERQRILSDAFAAFVKERGLSPEASGDFRPYLSPMGTTEQAEERKAVQTQVKYRQERGTSTGWEFLDKTANENLPSDQEMNLARIKREYESGKRSKSEPAVMAPSAPTKPKQRGPKDPP